MSNPILGRTELSMSSEKPLTIKGVIQKSAFLLTLCAAVAIGLFTYGMQNDIGAGKFMLFTMVGFAVSVIMGLIMMFKPMMAKSLAIPYSMFEGLLIGGLSGVVAYKFGAGVPIKALLATFVTAAGMFTLYRTGMIKVTDKLRSVITSATIAIFIVYIVQWVLSLAFSSAIPGLFDGGMLAIGFSLFVITIASFNLLLDFDNVETAERAGVSEDMEWVLSVGLLATLVWMYIEFVRLLGFLED